MPMDRDGASFSLHGVTLPSGVFIVEVRGDLDLFTSPRLRAMLDQAVNAGSRGIVVDLLDVEMVDSSGLAALVFAQRRLGAIGRRLTVVVEDEGVLSRMRLAALDRIFTIATSRDEALGAAG